MGNQQPRFVNYNYICNRIRFNDYPVREYWVKLGNGRYMEKYVFIYSLEDPITNEIKYIGKTNNLKIRYSNHLCGKDKSYKKNWITSLKNKNLKPLMKIIDRVPESEWEFWEIFYISLFKSWGFKLVNGSLGGLGGNNVGRSKVKVVAYTQTGDIYKIYNSIKEAKLENNCSSGNIVSACKGEINTVKGLIWRYEKDSFNKFNIKNLKKKEIIRYDLNNNIIEVYSSIKEASLNLNCKPSNISRVLRGERRKYKQSYFKYKDIV